MGRQRGVRVGKEGRCVLRPSFGSSSSDLFDVDCDEQTIGRVARRDGGWQAMLPHGGCSVNGFYEIGPVFARQRDAVAETWINRHEEI